VGTDIENTQTVEQMVSSMKETIQAKIRSEFVSLMPPELLKTMVTAAITEFQSPQRDNYGHITNSNSPLQQMIHDELRKLLMQAVQEELNSAGYNTHWAHGEAQPGEIIRAIVKECIPDIVNAAIGNFIAMRLHDFRRNL
jgi:hypothetical protein